jgi:SIR2-like domain
VKTLSDAHYNTVVGALEDGDVVPLLGAGANLCGRSDATGWKPHENLPSGRDLAAYLAERFRCPVDKGEDLIRVSQYVALLRGPKPLFRELHDLFDADYPPTAVHRFVAGIPAILRERSHPVRRQLIVTTNYDDALERAFLASGEPFDVVSYVAERRYRGKFVHWPHGEQPRVIEIPNEYADISLDERTVILKLHGLVDRGDPDSLWESFVITEDHYIEYLTRTTLSEHLPSVLAEKLHNCNLLFLGYSLRDWNLRVILHRIWKDRDYQWPSWAVQIDPDPIDEKFWDEHDVEMFDVPLERYVQVLEDRLRAPALARD